MHNTTTLELRHYGKLDGSGQPHSDTTRTPLNSLPAVTSNTPGGYLFLGSPENPHIKQLNLTTELKITSPAGVGNSYCPPGENNDYDQDELHDYLLKLGIHQQLAIRHEPTAEELEQHRLEAQQLQDKLDKLNLKTFYQYENKLDRDNLVNGPPGDLCKKYASWVRDHIMLAASVDGRSTGYLAAKRGNKAYAASLQQRISDLEHTLPTIKLFDTRNPSNRHIKRYSKVLNLTLTYQHGKLSKSEAWDRVSKDLNLFIAQLRSKFARRPPGKPMQLETIRMARSYEAHLDGYPHINVILTFRNKRFSTFHHKGWDTRKQAWKYTWRISDYMMIKRVWEQPVDNIKDHVRGYADVQAFDSVEGLFDSPPASPGRSGESLSLPLMHAVKYILKDYTQNVYNNPEHAKGFFQTAILWATRKRSYQFSTSRDGKNLFVESLWGIQAAAAAEYIGESVSQNPDLTRDMETSEKFAFLGFAHYFDLQIVLKWKPPPDLSYDLPPEVVEFVTSGAVQRVQVKQ